MITIKMITDKLHGQVALCIVKKYLSEHNVKNTDEALEFIFNNYFDEWWEKSNKKNELIKEHILCQFFEETLEDLIKKHFNKKY